MVRETKSGRSNGISLPEVFDSVIERKRKSGYVRTADNYRSAANKLQAYASATSGLRRLSDLTAGRVASFVRWLGDKHKDKPQTVSFYFRTLRALYNGALADFPDMRVELGNPFKGLAPSVRPPTKRALRTEEAHDLLLLLADGRLPSHLADSLDVLLFMLFMCGMVFRDVYDLRWGMEDGDNHVHYFRSKTGVPIDTKIPPEARAIMERHRRVGCPYVFPFLREGSGSGGGKKAISERSALRRVNRHAGLIGKLAGLRIPLSTYVMRHTFATLMLEVGNSVELIGQCLGHTSIRTTQIYLDRISPGRVDKAVGKMLDLMFRPPFEAVLVKEKRKNGRKKKGKKERDTHPAPAGKALPMPPYGGETETAGVEPSQKKCLFLSKKETRREEVPHTPVLQHVIKRILTKAHAFVRKRQRWYDKD